jgi:hypothetical protein
VAPKVRGEQQQQQGNDNNRQTEETWRGARRRDRGVSTGQFGRASFWPWLFSLPLSLLLVDKYVIRDLFLFVWLAAEESVRQQRMCACGKARE